MDYRVSRAADRYRTSGDQGETWHAFSFGPHYDPDNTHFGLLLACNEEQVRPSAGFPEHRHAGIDIVTVVIDGTLSHTDSTGAKRLLGPGEVLVLRTGEGVLHSEYNADDQRDLHFLQLWLVGAGSYQVDVLRLRPDESVELPAAAYRYLHVFRGGTSDLGTGDALRLRGPARVRAGTDGADLVSVVMSETLAFGAATEG